METITFEVGKTPRVRVQSVGSDLRVVGRSGGTLEAQAPSRGDLSVTREGDEVVVSSRVGCLLFVPEGARIEVGAVGGDARLSGMTGEASLTTVGGDLNLRGIGAMRLGRVAGDVRLVQANGPLAAEWIGGDARIENLQADLELGQVEGSLYLRHVRGAVRVQTHGDVHAELTPPPGSHSRRGGRQRPDLPPAARCVGVGQLPGRGGCARGPAIACSRRRHHGLGTTRRRRGPLDLECGGDLRLELTGGGGAGLNDEWRQDLEGAHRSRSRDGSGRHRTQPAAARDAGDDAG